MARIFVSGVPYHITQRGNRRDDVFSDEHDRRVYLNQELLGHESLSSTQIYTHVSIDRIKQVYRDTHPHA